MKKRESSKRRGKREKDKTHARNIDPLMNPTISLTNQIPRIIQKLFFEIVEEKVIADDLDRFFERVL